MIDQITNWMTSMRESRWHLIKQEGAVPLALCTHQVRGAVQRIISAEPPDMGDGRAICPSCRHVALEIRRKCEEVTVRTASLNQALQALEDNPIVWPMVDQDKEEVPGSLYLPGTERELTAAA